MKRLLDGKFLFIVALSLIVLIVLGIGSFYLFNDNDATFTRSGYVLNPLSPKVERYYFNEDTGYKENLSQMIEFKDIDNNDVTILKESFLHYNDGSMSFLKKGAILDLDSIKETEAVKFYNITNKSIIEKKNGRYVIKTNGDDVDLNNFIGRISDDKYIVAGSLEAKIPGNNTNVKADYFEIVYTEEGIVNIENKDVKYQVTAEGTYIYTGTTVIDLGNKKITKNGQDVMSLTSITINGDENIEIIPATEDNDKNNDSDNSTDNNGNVNDNENPGDGTGNDGNQTGDDGTDLGDDTQEKDDIIVSLKDASVGSTSVDVSFDIENQSALDKFTLKVTNLNSGRTVSVFDDVRVDQDIRVNLLSPNTKYLFTLINEQDQGKYFQKIFETNDFGITLEKNYATSDSLSYKVTVAEGSDITNAKLSLYKFNEETNKNEIVKTSYYDVENDETKYIEKTYNLSSMDDEIVGTHIVTFDSLDSNTIYTAVLDEFSVVSTNFKDVYNISSTNLTLKKAPSFSDMTVDKDVSTNEFKLALSDIVDTDNAITNYTYLIYENGSDNTAIAPINKTNASAINVKIGDKDNELKNDTNYYYKVVIEYFDNEKYVEYVTSDSINFIMGTEPYITVIPNPDQISFDTIGATIYLIDNSCLISMPGRDKCDGESSMMINVSKVNAITGETVSVFSKVVDFNVSENEIKYNLYLDNLQAGTTYTISARAVRSDLQSDELVEILHTDESKRTITTKTLSSFITEWKNQESNANHVVNLDSKLIGQAGTGTMSAEDSASAINKMILRLYSGNYSDDLQSQQPIATKTFINTDDFNIKANFFDKVYNITSDETFGLDLDQLRLLGENGKLSEFYTIALSAYYDTNETSAVRINNNIISYKISSVLLMENVEDPQLHIEKITKKQSELNSNLTNDGTVVGYKVTAAFDRTGLLENHLEPHDIDFYVYSEDGRRVKFYIANENGNLVLTDKINAELGTDNYYEAKIYMDYGSEYGVVDQNMSRGNKYYIGYELNLIGEQGNEKYPVNKNRDVNTNYGLYQSVISEKETPLLKMYVAKSTADSITYRYEIVDADNALYKEPDEEDYGFYYIINDGDTNRVNLNRTADTVKMFSGEMTINGLDKNDVYKIYYKKNITKTDNFEQDVLDYFDGSSASGSLFDGFYNATEEEYNFKFSIINNPLSDNKVIIKVLASDDIVDRILSYRVSFNDSKGNTLNKDVWKLSSCGSDQDNMNRCFTVDYIDLKNAGMKSENNNENPIRVTVKAFYDNGLTGYDYTVGSGKEFNYMILQGNNTATEFGKYIAFSSRGQLTNWTDAIDMPKGYYTYNVSGNRIIYNSALNSAYSASISFNVTSKGYESSFGALNPKMVSVDDLASDNNIFSFSSITPKVNVNGVTRLINGAMINMTLSGADIADFCENANSQACVNTANGDKYLYVDVWNNQEDVGDNSKKIIPTQKVKINNSNPNEELKIIIDKIENSQTYYYQIYAYLNKNDRSVYTQLFDAGYIDRYETKTYTFQTLSSTDIINAESIDISYKSNEEGNYGDKLLDTKFNLLPYNNNISFNYDVGYAFCLIDDENCGIAEDSSNIFMRTVAMNDLKAAFVDTQDISAFDLEYDKNYKLYVYAVFDVYDKETGTINKKNLLLNRRNYSVKLKKLAMPEFVIGREAVYVDGKYAIDFSINVNDANETLINGQYFVKLIDANGLVVGNLQVRDDSNNYVTVAANGNYDEYPFDASIMNKNIRITELVENTKYTIIVTGSAYINNYSADIPKEERTVVIEKNHTVYSTNRSGVAFGNDLTFSATEKSIVVTFLGGSNFDNVREVNYTIGLWDNEHSEATFSGSYNLSDSSKKFEYHADTDDWRFVIDPEGMTNVIGQTYTVALSFGIYNQESDTIDYYDSVTNPAFAGRAQYVKDNTK